MVVGFEPPRSERGGVSDFLGFLRSVSCNIISCILSFFLGGVGFMVGTVTWSPVLT